MTKKERLKFEEEYKDELPTRQDIKEFNDVTQLPVTKKNFDRIISAAECMFFVSPVWQKVIGWNPFIGLGITAGICVAVYFASKAYFFYRYKKNLYILSEAVNGKETE